MKMSKIDGKDVDLLMSHRAAFIAQFGVVVLQVTLEGKPDPLSIALQPDQVRKVSASLLKALEGLQSIQ